MTVRTIHPTGRGFLLLDSHPVGCAQLVHDMRAQVTSADAYDGRRPIALVIGSSGGYGLAATITGIARYRIAGVALCYEKAPTERRTATAGWYRTAATAQAAAEAGSKIAFVNADGFADATKHQVCELIAQRFGSIDYLVYSVAAPAARIRSPAAPTGPCSNRSVRRTAPRPSSSTTAPRGCGRSSSRPPPARTSRQR